MNIKALRLIIAEDDLDDQLLLRDALADNGIEPAQTLYVKNGDELIQQLKSSPDQPHMVLLDLNMPKKDGRQALKEIKSTAEIKHIPIIVLTTSNSSDEIIRCYREGTNTFFTKPSSYHDLVEIVRIIKKYWLEKASIL